MSATGRNDPCPCGSGKKYKKCCLQKDEAASGKSSQAARSAISIQEGIAHHQAGRLEAAEAIYREILKTRPDQPDALHMLGMLAHQKGDNETALALLTRVLAKNPSSHILHNNLGLIYRARNMPEEALRCYKKALSLAPGFADAHSNMGDVLEAQGRFEDALASCRKALSIKPDFAEAHNNLGNALLGLGRPGEAADSYRKALSGKPGFADGHRNLGHALKAQCRLDEAADSYRQALSFEPDNAHVLNDLGTVLDAQGKPDEAVECYRRAIVINPRLAEAHNNLGNVLKKQGRQEEAIASYRTAMGLSPKFASLQHLISAMNAETSERPPSEYVERLFDGYAYRFDSHLVQSLGYRMPQELVGLLARHADLPNGGWAVLDLGCGTGLSGQELQPYASRLVGVDLSGKMLDRARQRNIYQRLERADLLLMMQGEEAQSYDVVMAADVLEYLGKLDDIVSEAKRLLRSGGFFLFSVEALEPLLGEGVPAAEIPDYRLNQSGRYAHSSAYLAKMAAANGFESLCQASLPLRLENENEAPLLAWAAVWKCRA